jgi:hypothetical protein
MRRIITITGEPVYSGEGDYAVFERTIIGEAEYAVVGQADHNR